MPSIQRSAAVFGLLAIFLAASLFAVTKSHPNLAGVWKLDRDLTTAHYVKDDTLVVQQSKVRVKFTYQTDGKITGTDVFVTNGKELDRYKTRIERAFYRARWKDDRLEIVTSHALDIFGYQNYKETDYWTLDDNGKTLTEHLSDGKLAVYYYKGPPPDEPSEEAKEFRALAQFSGGLLQPAPGGECRYDLSGTLKSSLLGAGSYRLCLSLETASAADPGSGCEPLRGTMNLTADDGVSAFVMKVAGRFCPKEQNFVGSYEVDPERITGAFNQHLSGGSGTVQFSHATDTMVLYGVLLYD